MIVPSDIRRKRGNGFNPQHIGGLVLWNTSARGVNSGVYTDATPVATWENWSGQGTNAVQSTEAKKPLLETGEIFGKPSVNFDGTDDYLDTQDALQSTFRASFTIITVVAPDDGIPAVQNILCGTRDTDGPENYVEVRINTNGQISFRYTANDNDMISRTNAAVFSDGQETQHIVSCWADSTVGGLGAGKVWFDGVAQTLVSGDGDSTGVTFSEYTSSTTAFLGARNNVTSGDEQHLAGSMPEFMLYNRALSESELHRVHQYLKLRYGIA